MSDVGLNSNIYRIAGKYLSQLNNFLVEINFNPNQISEEHVSSIQSFLEKLADDESRDFQTQMVYIIINKYLKNKGKSTEKTLTNLLTHFEAKTYLQSEVIEELEMLSAALDEECDYAFSRIRGK